VCAYIFIYIYVCIMHKRTSRYNSSGREKWVVSIDIGRQSTTTRIRKLEYLYFCVTLVPIYFHPIYFHSLQPHPRLCLYSILSSRNILMLENGRFRTFVPRFPSSSFPSSSSFNGTRANRASLTISESLRFILTLISFFIFRAHVCLLFFHSFCHSFFLFRFSLSLIYSFLLSK